MTVSNIGAAFYNNQIITNLNSQLNKLEYQVSTGNIAQNYADLGAQAGTSLNLHAQYNALGSYTSAINTVQLKTTQMDAALTDATNQIQTVTSDMDKLTQGGVPDATTLATIQSAAQDALSSIMADLNTNVNGEYVFAGTQTNTPPVANTSAASTNVGNIVSTYTTGTPASTIIASLNAMTETQLGYDPGLAAAGNNTFQAADNVNLNYTVKADGSAFQDVITGLSEIANLQYSPSNSSSFWSLYSDAQSRLSSGSTGVTSAQSQLGVVSGQMASLVTSQQTSQGNVQTSISGIESTNLSQASAQLSTLQTQQQAVYELISRASEMSLLNYLPTPT